MTTTDSTPTLAPTGRFAPSPTGELHLGNLRTALAAWLFARSSGGRFLIRVDDLDPDRCIDGMGERQLQDLRLLGIDWDAPPTTQRDRFPIYDRVIAELQRRELTYPCFCSRAEIRAAASAPHGPHADGVYPGTCYRLSAREREQRINGGAAHCLRAHTARESLTYTDDVLGPVTMTLDDFVIRRRDGVPAYNLATVIDDAELGVTQVVRGADLATTTPRQLWLYSQLDLPAPSHAHIPLVLGDDGARLAKRHGGVTLAASMAAWGGIDRVRGMLARSLGSTGIDASASIDDVLASFAPARVPHTTITWSQLRDDVQG